MAKQKRAKVRKYSQKSVSKRIEAFFLDNVGRIATREQIQQVARNPETGKIPENWHQRLSELRTDLGYTILSWRDRVGLGISEYLMPTSERRLVAGKRVRIKERTWKAVLERAGYACEWAEGGVSCALKAGDID